MLLKLLILYPYVPLEKMNLVAVSLGATSSRNVRSFRSIRFAENDE